MPKPRPFSGFLQPRQLAPPPAQPQPRLQAIMSRWLWFTNSPPTWPKALSQQAASTLTVAWVKRLRRAQRSRPPYQVKRKAPKVQRDLAKTLERCRVGARCTNGACPVCGRAFQRWLVTQLIKQSGGDA